MKKSQGIDPLFRDMIDLQLDLIAENTKKIVMVVHKKNMVYNEYSDKVLILSRPLFERKVSLDYRICKASKYASQPSAFCEGTGFFIEEKVVATAAHVVVKPGYDMRDYVFVQCLIKKDKFDFDKELIVPKACVWEYDGNKPKLKNHQYQLFAKDSDWALMHVKPAFSAISQHSGKVDIRFRKDPRGNCTHRKPQVGDKVYSVGHGLGLPMKLSSEGEIIKVEENYFECSLTLLGGNSGSPIFFKDDHSLAGIYMRGIKKLQIKEDRSCLEVKQDYQRFEGQECQKMDAVLESVEKLMGITKKIPKDR